MNFFSDKKYLPYEGCSHTHFLFPVWGELVEDIYQGHNVYGQYKNQFCDLYTQVSDLQAADFVVLPANIKQYARNGKMDVVLELLRLSKQANKKLVIFFKDDSDLPLDVDVNNTIVFRTSFYRSKRKKNEFAMPVWSGDLINVYEQGNLRASSKPALMKIGFCGQTIPKVSFLQKKWKKLGFELDLAKVSTGRLSPDEFGKRWFSFLRQQTLELLRQDDLFNCDFVMLPTYLGGSWVSKGVFNIAQYEKARAVFIDNLKSSDFFPCIRGGGNYSLRLFEVMSMGKIPVFIDTDSVIPFDDVVNWKEHFCWVAIKDLAKIAQQLRGRYSSITESDFIQWQIENRKLWEEYFSPEGFFKNIKRYLS